MNQAERAPFESLAAPLVGLPIAHVWQGYGSAIFLEFGGLRPTTRLDGSSGNPDGEMGLMIEWSWRIEGKRSILCGSYSDEVRWPRAFACLAKARVSGATLFGRVPEIDVALSNGVHVVSLMTGNGQPRWVLFDRRDEPCRWLCVEHGRLRVDSSRP